MRLPWCLLVVLACGAEPTPGSGTDTESSAASDSDASGVSDPDSDSESDSGPATDSDSSTGSVSDSGSDADTSGSGATSESDSGGDAGPVELYRGPVDGGSVPGWDPDNPQPLVMMGRQGDEWVATLARIAADGSLSDNTAEEIIVWGFAIDPPELYDGPVTEGSIDGWDPDDPPPLVMMGQQGDEWVATLASIQPDGTLGDNVAERIIVWGWSPADPGVPSLRYEGPVGGGSLDGWDADNPDPLVMLGTPGLDIWLATLIRIAADGSLSDNFAASVKIWGW